MVNFENPQEVKNLKTEDASEALDNKWYERFKDIVTPVDYSMGDESLRKEQKKLFLNDQVENPNLGSPEISNSELEEIEKRFLELKKDLMGEEKDELIKQIYRWRINEKIARVRMLKATKRGEDKRFFRYSKFIYGEPEKEIYEYTLAQVRKWIDEKMFDSNSEIKEAAKRLNKELFDSLMNNESQINFEDYRGKKISKPKSIEGEVEYSSDEIAQAFREAMVKKSQLEGWKVVVDNEGKYVNINIGQNDKEVRIPKEKKLKKTKLKSVIVHEIVHMERREKGQRTKLKLLGPGLDRYLRGEEGVTTYEEQKVKGSDQFAGFINHFAISLATGMDGKKRNFREVFEIMKDFYFIKSPIEDKKKALERAETLAWKVCVRTFRGTSCKTKGSCYTKDIVYREGNIGVYNVIKDNPQEERRFMIGKYDPSNSRHIWVLDQLGINEKDLEDLEK